MIEQTRRYKRLVISERDILNVMNWNKDKHEFITLPEMPTLPSDATIEHVSYDFCYGGFLLTIHSETFPEVELGHEIPRAVGVLEKKSVVFKRETLPDGRTAFIE